MAAKTFAEIAKFNPYHDAKGRFASANAATSFTYAPGKSTAHDKAIQHGKKSAETGKGFKGTLYHGSPSADIEEFDLDRAGSNTSSGEKLIYFTDSKQMAEDFSYERLEGSTMFTQQRGKKGRVYEVDVEMKNPLDFRNLTDTDVENILQLDADGLLTKDLVQSLSANHQLLKASLNLSAENLKKLGYDGMIASTGKAGHGSLEYAVVDSKQAKIRKAAPATAKTFSEVLKFNPYHDRLGRFTSAGSETSFTYAPGKSKAHDRAIERHKERMASVAPTEAQTNTLRGIETRTRNLKKEQFRVVDREGNVVMQKQGDRNSVSYSVGEARDHFPGNITIHNHPDGGTFSAADLSDIGYGATEIRAAAPEGTYSLRNLNYRTKWTPDQKSWMDMRNDIDEASQSFKTGRQLRSELREPYEKQVKPLAEKWARRRDEGASQEELNKISAEYTAKWDALKPQLEQATRKAYVDQYHHWYKENAGKYGFEYSFTPTQTRTRKSDTVEEFDDIDEIEKSSGEIILDQKMHDDVQEIVDDILSEYPRELTAADVEKSVSIFKTDDDKRLVFGWASVSITVDGEQLEDRQQDLIDPEDLEEAAYEYVLHFRDTGERHNPNLRKKGKLVESCVFTAEKQKAMGIPEGIIPVGWWIGFKIEDDEAWEKVKNGVYKMFSIEGKANRVPVE